MITWTYQVEIDNSREVVFEPRDGVVVGARSELDGWELWEVGVTGDRDDRDDFELFLANIPNVIVYRIVDVQPNEQRQACQPAA